MQLAHRVISNIMYSNCIHVEYPLKTSPQVVTFKLMGPNLDKTPTFRQKNVPPGEKCTRTDLKQPPTVGGG